MTGLAKITGGTYRIEHEVGSAIALFVPPPQLLCIDWELLKQAHEWFLEEFDKHWQIIAHWLVYFRAYGVDIKQFPFTSPEFQDKRPLAELYNSQLNLCASIWEAIEIRHFYPTAYDWWVACLREQQEAHFNSILTRGGIEDKQLLKGEIEDGLRKFLRNLKDGEIPFTESEKNQHLYRLYHSAINYRYDCSDSEKVKKAWKDYLDNFNLYIRSLKNNKEIKAVIQLGEYLYYKDTANRNIRILLPQ